MGFARNGEPLRLRTQFFHDHKSPGKKTMNPMTRSFAIVLTLGFAATTVQAQEVSGGPFSRLVRRIRQHHSAASYSGLTTVQAAPQSAAPATASARDFSNGADPYGFTAILNQHRAEAGLRPVSYDVELSSWASRNNAVQCRRGIGHHVNPSCYQNCGWNYADAESVAQGWMNSPGHRDNMLSPSITRFGIAMGPGPYWTLNAR
jgi:uncharacterized protein YkwD